MITFTDNAATNEFAGLDTNKCRTWKDETKIVNTTSRYVTDEAQSCSALATIISMFQRSDCERQQYKTPHSTSATAKRPQSHKRNEQKTETCK